ncbi:MAG TPA: DUF4625 domain-containing protein [Saprospiraceae bacterium]|nr:DUF4625 domain-containing protein [Saprospiraceae bacterium]HMQ84770.1 DUF4625 domain-containing protein [Saprospiraceae bacterium]
MKKVIIASFVLSGLLIISCGKEAVDTNAPSMQIKTLTPAPYPDEICGSVEDTVFHLKGGQVLDLELLFQDETSLSQYKVDIHNNFDCHGHGSSSIPGVSQPDVTNTTTDWTVLEIKDLTGQESVVDLSLDVPDNVTAGNYHFQIQVVDEAGNDNPLANFYAIKVKNPLDEVAPMISTTAPVAPAFTAAKGSKLRFAGQVSDERSLSDGGNGVLFLSYTDLSSGNTFNTDRVFYFGSQVGQTYDFDFEYQVPNTLKAGDYLLILSATDGVRNVAEAKVFEVEITN